VIGLHSQDPKKANLNLHFKMSRSAEMQPLHVCAVCGEAISGEFLRVNLNMYHPQCMKCSYCGVNLDDSAKVNIVNGKWYCRRDFARMFGSMCGKCESVIEPGSPYYSACGKYFHVYCFVCYECGAELTGGIHFVKNNTPVCEQHKEPEPTVLLYEAITLLVRTTKGIFEWNPDADRTRLVHYAKQLAISGKYFTDTMAKSAQTGVINQNQAVLEEEVNQCHRNFFDFSLSMLIDDTAKEYLLQKRKFVCSADNFVESAQLLEKIMNILKTS